MIDEKLPSVSEIQESSLGRWTQATSTFNYTPKWERIPTVYGLELKANPDNPFASEELLVDDVKVISIQSGEGMVQDENGTTQDKIQVR